MPESEFFISRLVKSRCNWNSFPGQYRDHASCKTGRTRSFTWLPGFLFPPTTAVVLFQPKLNAAVAGDYTVACRVGCAACFQHLAVLAISGAHRGMGLVYLVVSLPVSGLVMMMEWVVGLGSELRRALSIHETIQYKS